ncbi:MAG TPA: peptidylprolyl isomerase [Euzebyales bacterium]|nr:peptidylprolyl isomerase [Euzebyales bacterium]
MRFPRISVTSPSSVLVAVVCTILVAACGGAAGSDVAATVGDVQITTAEVDEAYQQRAEGPAAASELAGDESGAVEEELKAGVLTNLIRTEVLHQAAEERDIEVTDEEIAEQRALLVEQAGGEEALQEVIENANVSDEELRANLRDQVIQNEITSQLAEGVDQVAIEDAYEKDPQGRYGAKVEVRHILTEKRAQARDAMERLEAGEDFGEVASEVSIDPGSAENGGDLGAIGRGATVPPFEKAAFNAEVGELVGPVRSDFGFHVLEVTGRVPAPDLADVESQIRTELEAQSGGQAFNEFITGFVADLDIEVDEQYGRWDEAAVAVVSADQGSEAPGTPSDLPLPTELPSELPTG